MSDYTPTKDHIVSWLMEGAYTGQGADQRAEAFERWLAEHDAELRAESLREAAQEMDEIEAKAEIAEFAAYVEGETGRQSVIDAAAEMQKDPAQWVRTRADRIEREAGLK